MHKYLLSLLLLPGLSMAQQSYEIQGSLKDVKSPAKAFLRYSINGEVKLDSSKITNGKFAFKGSVKEVVPASLYVIHSNENFSLRTASKDFKSIYLESGTLKVIGADSIKHSSLEGGKTVAASLRLAEDKKPINEEMREALKKYYDLAKGPDSLDKEKQKAALDTYYAVGDKLIDKDVEFIAKNADNYVSLERLNYNLRDIEVAKAESLFKALSPELQNSSVGAKLEDKIKARKSVSIGQVAPNFTVADTVGKDFTLSSTRGKYVLIDFWASWCGPCRKENPNVVAAFNKFKDKNFTIVGVSLDNPGQKDAWLKAIAKDGLQNWTQVSDLKGWQTEIGKLYAVDAIPQNFLLDPEGKIVATNLREEGLHKKLEELLN